VEARDYRGAFCASPDNQIAAVQQLRESAPGSPCAILYERESISRGTPATIASAGALAYGSYCQGNTLRSPPTAYTPAGSSNWVAPNPVTASKTTCVHLDCDSPLPTRQARHVVNDWIRATPVMAILRESFELSIT